MWIFRCVPDDWDGPVCARITNWGGPQRAIHRPVGPTAGDPGSVHPGAPGVTEGPAGGPSVDVTGLLAAGAAVFQPACWLKPIAAVSTSMSFNLLDDGINQPAAGAVGSARTGSSGRPQASPTPAATLADRPLQPERGRCGGSPARSLRIVLSATSAGDGSAGWRIQPAPPLDHGSSSEAFRAAGRRKTDAPANPSCCCPASGSRCG